MKKTIIVSEVISLINNVQIELVKNIDKHVDELSELLVKVVEDDASIGFLPPLQFSHAKKYWLNVLNPHVLLFVAMINNKIVGSVQLQLCTKQNGVHRAEIAKLMTDPNYRRNGIARSLMYKVEERAKQEGRSLLVLDTREGDSSNLLYSSLGYIKAGKIPFYAKSANGELHTTIVYYKAF